MSKFIQIGVGTVIVNNATGQSMRLRETLTVAGTLSLTGRIWFFQWDGDEYTVLADELQSGCVW